MHLKKFHIQGFRGISELEIDQLSQINLFVGRNNASKTSILEAIFLLLGAGNPELSMRIDNFRGLSHNEEDDFRFIFHQLNYDFPLCLKGYFDIDGSTRELKIKPSQSGNKASTTKKISSSNIGDSSIDNSSKYSKINELNYELTIKKNHKQKALYKANIAFDNGFSVTLPENYKEEIKAIYIIQSLITGGNDKRLENLLVNKKESKLIEALKQIEPKLSAIILGTNRMIYFDVGLDRLVPISLFGDGTRRLLSILLTISDAQDGIVIIDEIDNGLHFSALKFLWNAIIVAAQEYNVQIFVTTHNYETLKYLKDALEQKNFINFQDRVMNYTIRKLPDSTIKAYPYSFKSFELAIEEGIEIR
jgi:AAA15 family ATPase/GTPase